MNNIFRTIDKDEFPRLFQLMQASFPASEFRNRAKQLALLDRPGYKPVFVEKGGRIQAFLAEWDFAEFRFIEHFAVDPDARGKGVGSDIMRAYLSEVAVPIVIEVESPYTEIAKRRISFYEKLAFVLSSIEYKQPSLRKNAAEVSLRLMYYPRAMTHEALNEAKEKIFQTIYER